MSQRVYASPQIVFLIVCFVTACESFIITKAECKSLDLSFAHFKTCAAKTDDKGNTKLDFYVDMRYKKPIDEVMIGVALYKVAKTYRIPIFNETIDYCAFMRTETFVTGIFSFINEILMKYTNANHPCPYQHDIVVKALFPDELLPAIPAPTGNYIVQLRVGAFKKWKGDIKFYAIKRS